MGLWITPMGHLFNEQCDPACHSGHQQQPDAGCCDEHRIRDEEACLYDIDFEGRYLHALSSGHGTTRTIGYVPGVTPKLLRSLRVAEGRGACPKSAAAARSGEKHGFATHSTDLWLILVDVVQLAPRRPRFTPTPVSEIGTSV